ncbi:cell wall hydrolase [Thermaurantiacus sp.]
MINVRRPLVAAGLAVLMLAAGEAPFDADVGQWLSGQATVAPQSSVDAAADVPPFIEDPEILKAALVEEPQVRVRPDSLAALVAELRSEAARATFSPDMECLARAVYWEAKGERLEGQLAVAEVILNRVADGRFGRDVCAVIKAPRQFSFVRAGVIPAPVDQAAYLVARAIALIAIKEHWTPVVGDATHFHATYVRPGWRLTRVAQVGNHIFYR